MGSLVLLCAERLGLWDVTTFFTLFLFMWIIIRSTYVEVATIVAFYFDFVIPLQYASTLNAWRVTWLLIYKYR